MKYRREIDGLRAVAVVPVILFHAGFKTFQGGYVGVDIFFVISGFLITSILLDELQPGNFSITTFYNRRAKRILPALFVVMLSCLPFAYFWMLPSQLADFSESLIAVLFFVSNILFWQESGYFSAAADLQPMLHTWSLAVEAQYYLIFPIFLLLLWRLGRDRAFGGVIALTAASFILSEWISRSEPSASFYLAPTRAWELLVGSICAFISVDHSRKPSNVLSAVGIILIVFAIFHFDEGTPYPSGYTIVPVTGAALIILYGSSGTWVWRFLSKAPVVGVGLISYSAYLWHQPLFAFARIRSLTEPTQALMAVLSIASIFLGWATWKFVEQPFRKRGDPRLGNRWTVFTLGGAAASAFIALGLSGHFGNGFSWRTNGAVSLAELDKRVELNTGLSWQCSDGFNKADECKTSDNPSILLWGDSFAMHLASGLKSSATNGFVQQTVSQCAPVAGIAQANGWMEGLDAQACIDFNAEVLTYISEQEFDVVIISSPFNDVLNKDIQLSDGSRSSTNTVDHVTQKLLETIEAIRATGARVMIVSPTPRSGWDIGLCAMRSEYFDEDEASCDFALNTKTLPYTLLRGVSDSVPVYWLYDDICKDGVCDSIQDGIFIYRDWGHLSNEGSAYLGHKHNWMKNFYANAR